MYRADEVARKGRTREELRPEGHLESPLCFSPIPTAYTVGLRRNSLQPELLKQHSRLPAIIVACLLAFGLLIPLMLVRELPMLDWPNHLARIFVLQHLGDSAYIFAHYFRADWAAYPYV